MSKSERVDEAAFLAPLVTGTARIARGVGKAVKSLARKLEHRTSLQSKINV